MIDIYKFWEMANEMHWLRLSRILLLTTSANDDEARFKSLFGDDIYQKDGSNPLGFHGTNDLTRLPQARLHPD